MRLGSIQPDAVRGVIMSEPRSCWSGEAQALTREALAAGADGTGLCLKHSAGRFGVVVDARPHGGLRVVDRRDGTRHTFTDPEALIAAGWVVD